MRTGTHHSKTLALPLFPCSMACYQVCGFDPDNTVDSLRCKDNIFDYEAPGCFAGVNNIAWRAKQIGNGVCDNRKSNIFELLFKYHQLRHESYTQKRSQVYRDRGMLNCLLVDVFFFFNN